MGHTNSTHEQKQVRMRERHAPEAAPQLLASRFAERHFSTAEIGEMWGLGQDKVREMFRNEPGVLVIGGKGGRGKRRYETLRIPESVLERVHRRLSNA